MNLTDRAMLVDLSIRSWASTKVDTKVSAEVAANHGSDVDMGRFSKSLLTKDATRELTRIKGSARTAHYERTLPWNDNGQRVLSSAGYFDYASIMRGLQSEWENAVDEFCSRYDEYVRDARRRLNGLFRDSDYPTVSQIRSKFAFGFNVTSIITGKDFRVDLGASEVARIQADIEAKNTSMLDSAMADVWQRMKDHLTHLVDRLKSFDPNAPTESNCEICNGTGDLSGVTCYVCSGAGVIKGTKVANPFRDSLIGNIRDLLALLPTLNITGNKDLAAFAAMIESQLLDNSADTLRASQWKRDETIANAEDILAKMADFI